MEGKTCSRDCYLDRSCDAHYTLCVSCKNPFFRNEVRDLEFVHLGVRFRVFGKARNIAECDGCAARHYIVMFNQLHPFIGVLTPEELRGGRVTGVGYEYNLKINWSAYKAALKKHRRKKGMNIVRWYNKVGKFADVLCATGVLVPYESELASWHILGVSESGDKMFFGPADYSNRVLGFRDSSLKDTSATQFARVFMKRDFTAYRKWETLLCGNGVDAGSVLTASERISREREYRWNEVERG